MILADKIIALRKRSGWSQEELAAQLGVTRQSVSKWEGAQSVPDLERILQMANLFSVSTDYLLRDELEQTEGVSEAADETQPAVRRVSMEEADEFLRVKAHTAPRIAFATALCILSPIALLLLGAAGELGRISLSEDAACGVGLIVMLLLIVPAVALFIACGMKTNRFEYLEREEIETAYGVTGMVRQRQERYHPTYTKYNVIGACLCILAVVPLFSGLLFAEDDLLYAALIGALLAIVAVGVAFFIVAGIQWASLQKLLEEGDYARTIKRKSRTSGAIGTVYWLLVTAGFLGYCFATDDWQRGWIVWPVAGVLFAALMVTCGALSDRKKK